MSRSVGIGIQDFEKLIEGNYFYIDKTDFIREWWENGDDVTLITRPRRFGKTLTMSMVEHFFSIQYAEKGNLFAGLSIWQEEKYRKLQGTYPVISLSFADIKDRTYQAAREKICQIIVNLYGKYDFLLESSVMNDRDREFFDSVRSGMGDVEATLALKQLSDYLNRYYGKKVIILLDEYDTPMQEAYVNGYWEELVGFTRSLFNSTFKTNPYLARGLMTGITRVSRESIFSDLNNLEVVTTTSNKYALSFGFTEEEVFAALDEKGLGDRKAKVKYWYDGFVFGKHGDIYNPWSILNFLDKGEYDTYWANTSGNSLVGKLIREGDSDIKQKFEELLQGCHVWTPVDEQIVYSELDGNPEAVWSLLLAGGYLRVCSYERPNMVEEGMEPQYELALTNYEVKIMFEKMVKGWFAPTRVEYNGFIKALLQDDIEAMNHYMGEVAENIFSIFDSGKRPSRKEPERFYHGFVLGLLVELRGRYIVTSNRESGFGRYDVMLEPKKPEDSAIILEFKVFNARREQTLEDTVKAALAQIQEKNYAAALVEKGIPENRIRSYGFAFQGKTVLIG